MQRLLVILLTLVPLSAFAGELAPGLGNTPEHYAQQLTTLGEIREFFTTEPREATIEHRVQIKAVSGDTLVYEGEVNVVTGSRGAARIYTAMRENPAQAGKYEGKLKAFVLAADVGWDVEMRKHPGLAADMAAGDAMPFTRFSFAGLDFRMLVPGAERVILRVDRRELEALNWTPGPDLHKQFAARPKGPYHHVADFAGPLEPVAEYWLPLSTGEPQVVNR